LHDPPRLGFEKVLAPDGREHLLQAIVAEVPSAEHLACIGAPHDREPGLIK
jgi:hypothetical protein